MFLHLAWTVACAPEPLTPVGPAWSRERVANGPVDPTSPDCSLLVDCPQLGVDTARCVEDPGLFVVETFDGRVSNVELATGVATALADGEWFGVFPDPAGACALTLFSLRVEGGAP